MVKGGCWGVYGYMLGCYVFMLMFNVSSFPLMFFQVGFLGIFCQKVSFNVCVGVVVIFVGMDSVSD
jgi:hypothetical protein